MGHLGMAVNKVIEISPEGLLMIFLPVLIFESAFNADWHIFRRQISQILILSFPCVVCGSVLIMISIKEIIGYGEVTSSTLRTTTPGLGHSCLAASSPVLTLWL